MLSMLLKTWSSALYTHLVVIHYPQSLRHLMVKLRHKGSPVWNRVGVVGQFMCRPKYKTSRRKRRLLMHWTARQNL